MNKKIFIKLAISIFLVAYLLRSINLNELHNSFKNANIPLMILVFSTFIPAVLVSTFKWMLLLRAQGFYKPGFTRLWGLYFIGMYFSNFLPTEVGGDVVKSYAVGKTTGNQTASLATVAQLRIRERTARLNVKAQRRQWSAAELPSGAAPCSVSSPSVIP
jgi:hypothetical protein